MVTPIYLPPDYGGVSPGAAIGKGISAYFDKVVEEQEKQKKRERIQRTLESIKASGSRKKAFELMATLKDDFEDPADVRAAIDFINETFPEDENDLVGVKGYGPTGEESTKYVPKGKLGDLNTPEGMEGIFGPGYTTTKPNILDMYDPESNEYLGQFRQGDPSIPEGALPSEAIKLRRQMEADARAEKNAALTERRTAAFERLVANQGNRMSESQAINLTRKLGSAERSIAGRLGGKYDEGLGTFNFDDDKLEQANKAFVELEKVVTENPDKSYIWWANEAMKRAGIVQESGERPPQATPKTETKKDVKEEGEVSKMLKKGENFVRGKPEGKGGSKETSGELPPANVVRDLLAKMKEGATVTFENGQVWKKEKGELKRIK